MKLRNLLSPTMLHASRASRCPVFRSLLKTVPMRPPALLVRGRRTRVPPRTNDPAAPRTTRARFAANTGSSPAADLRTSPLATRTLVVGRTPRDTTKGPHCMKCRLPGARMSTPAFPFLRRFIGHAQGYEASRDGDWMSSPLTGGFLPRMWTYVVLATMPNRSIMRLARTRISTL